MNTIFTDLLLFIVAIIAVLLLVRWRTSVATQKLLDHPMPDVEIGLPQHPDGVLLLFHHPRCGPCRQVVKQFDHIANTAPERVRKINVGESLELARAFAIRSTPTVLFIKDNTVNAAFVGATSLQKLQTLLKITP